MPKALPCHKRQMPHALQKMQFWSAMESALSAATTLQCPPAEALTSASRLIAPPPAQQQP